MPNCKCVPSSRKSPRVSWLERSRGVRFRLVYRRSNWAISRNLRNARKSPAFRYEMRGPSVVIADRRSFLRQSRAHRIDAPCTTQNLKRAPSCMTRGPPTESVILPKSVVADADHVVRKRIVHGVEHVEDVPSELEVPGAAEREALGEAQVDTALPEPAQRVSTEIAESQIVRITACRRHRRAQDALVERGLGRVIAGLTELIERATQTRTAKPEPIESPRTPNQVAVLADVAELRFG